MRVLRLPPTLLWVILGYFVVATAFFIYVRQVNHRQDRQDERTCAYVTFTRRTQQGVVTYIYLQATAASLYSGTPQLRAFYRSQLPVLETLLKRSSPPSCRL